MATYMFGLYNNMTKCVWYLHVQ